MNYTLVQIKRTDEDDYKITIIPNHLETTREKFMCFQSTGIGVAHIAPDTDVKEAVAKLAEYMIDQNNDAISTIERQNDNITEALNVFIEKENKIL